MTRCIKVLYKNSLRPIKTALRKSSEMALIHLGDILYSTWGLNPQCNYRAAGRLISSKGKVMLLFNFTDAEMWKGKKAGKDSE